jgi:hypothetical protein
VLEHMCQSGYLVTVDLLFTETYVPMTHIAMREFRRLFDQSVRRDQRGAKRGMQLVFLPDGGSAGRYRGSRDSVRRGMCTMC